MIQEYFQPKIGTRIRIFSLDRKNNILIKKKECKLKSYICFAFTHFQRTKLYYFRQNLSLRVMSANIRISMNILRLQCMKFPLFWSQIIRIHTNVVPRSTMNTNGGRKKLTLKCKFKLLIEPMNNPLGVSPS